MHSIQIKILHIRDGPLFSIGGGGLPFLGLANNFFLKSNAFQTVFHYIL